MFELYRTLSVRFLLRRGLRTNLVVLSIALGVAILMGTQSMHQLMSASAHEAYTPLAALGDLYVINSTGVNRDVLKTLRQAQADGRLPGVAEVRPLIVQYALVPKLDNRRVLVLGLEVDLSASSPMASLKDLGLDLNQTRAPPTSPEYLLMQFWGQYPTVVGSSLSADLNKISPTANANFEVRAGSGGLKTMVPFGTIKRMKPPPSSSAAALGPTLSGDVLYLSLDDAAAIFNQPDRVTRLNITLAPGANRDEVQARLQELVGENNQVLTPEGSDEKVNELMSTVEVSFTLISVCALVVGLFLVYNALSVSVAERRHDIGVLRAMGATRVQVVALFGGEAMLLGLVGSGLGVPVGWLMAWLALGAVKQMLVDLFGVQTQQLPPLNTGLVVLALGCGVLTALLAALVPALQASREEPADAVRRAPLAPGSLSRRIHIGISLALILAGLACAVLQPYLPHVFGIYGPPVLVLVGLLVGTPLMAPSVARLVQQPVRWVLGVPERLAADNLARSPGRTGLVIAALAAGVALMVQTAGVMQSSEDAILNWLDRTIAADLFVTVNSPVTSAGNAQPMSDRLRKELAARPEVRQVVPVRFHLTDYAGKKVYVIAVDGAHFIDRERLADAAPGTELFPQLVQPGATIVSENFVALYHVKVGDTIEFPGKTGRVRLKVIGSMADYTWTRGTVFVDREQYVRDFGDADIDIFNVFLKDPSPENVQAVRRTLESEKWGGDETLVVRTRDELRDGIRGKVRTLYAFGYAQELVVGVVAALGVLMAMLISVLQRRRELGLLRAVGASQGQVLRTVLAEAALMGLVGAVLGVLFGLPMEWYIIHIALLQEAGFELPLSLPWAAVGVVIALAMFLATVAGIWPALHAVRLRIADAIAYE